MAQNLQQLIESRGFTRATLAEAAGVGRSSVWRWATGLSTPYPAQVAVLAEVLEVTPARVEKAAARSRDQALEEV